MNKVLHIVGGMGLGGIETFLMNIYRNIDREKLQFDFVIYYKNKHNNYYEKEIRSLGGKIYYLNSSFNSLIFNLIRILRKEKYTALHTHTKFNGGISLIAALVSNVKIRIAHSHNTGGNDSNSMLRRIYNLLMHFAINTFATKYAACSKKAAEHLFTKRNIDKRYTFIPNAIDIEPFISSDDMNTNAMKSLLNIPINNKIVGHVGRYGKAKNHNFIVNMFSKLLKQDPNFSLILIGDGPTRPEIEAKINDLGIHKNVKVLGLRDDVPKLMNIFDVFILPSLYEGFGIVLLEAQACGLPCIVSENIQPEVDMGLDLIHKVNLNNTLLWIDTVNKNKNNKIYDKVKIKDKLLRSPFVVFSVVNQFYELYELN